MKNLEKLKRNKNENFVCTTIFIDSKIKKILKEHGFCLKEVVNELLKDFVEKELKIPLKEKK